MKNSDARETPKQKAAIYAWSRVKMLLSDYAEPRSLLARRIEEADEAINAISGDAS